MRRLAVAALVIGLAGCGGHGRASAPPPTSPPFGECDIAAASQAVSLHVSGDGAEAVCRAMLRTFGRQGEYWRPSASRRPAGSDIRACSFTNGTVTVDVFDILGGSAGERLCANLAGHGWTDLGP